MKFSPNFIILLNMMLQVALNSGVEVTFTNFKMGCSLIFLVCITEHTNEIRLGVHECRGFVL